MSPLAVIALLLALAGGGIATLTDAAAATPGAHYRWTDASGVIHYSDTIPPTALAGGYDIINSQGRVVRHVAREATPAERRSAAAAAARRADQRAAARQRELADTQLLLAYPSEADLAQAQQAQLQQMRHDIAVLETNLLSQEDSLTELLAHAADIEHDDKPIPAVVTKRIADQRDVVNHERGALSRRRAELGETEAKFTARLKHYRTLRARLDHPEGAAAQS